MNRTEHLLMIIAEECAEVAQRASKAGRFGLNEVEPGQEKTNAERILLEFEDLRTVIEMLMWADDFPHIEMDRFRHRIAKEKKVEEFLEYSAELGTLTEVAK